MPILIEVVTGNEALALLPVLLDSDEGDARIRAALLDGACTAYACRADGALAGAAVVRWGEPAEILFIAVADGMRGRGLGKQLIRTIQAELPRRGLTALLVGTANAALDNIAFYQKCGFRMAEVRRDYFDYIQPPAFENGIQIRDMLVLRYEPPSDDVSKP